MLLSIFADRAVRFAENLRDPETKNQIERYVRQRSFAGPVVTFVGAQGRGKSTLMGKVVGISPKPSVSIQFAGDTIWKDAVAEMNITDGFFHKANESDVGDVLFCDAPHFGSSERDKDVASLLAMTDFAVMTVQITQPAGADEVAFVRKYLCDIPSVLVLTKCDQVDEDDFQEGLEAVLDNYSDFPWIAVLLSDLDGRLTEINACGQSLINFEQWWQSAGKVGTAEARRSHLARLQKSWQSQARSALNKKEQEYKPQLEKVQEALVTSSSAARALQTQDELMKGLKVLPEQASSLYRTRLSTLRVQVSQVTYKITDGIKSGSEINQAEIERELSEVYQEWNQDTRIYVRHEIKADVERLQEVAIRYEELVQEATKTEAVTEMTLAADRQEVFGESRAVELQGNFDLTISDKLRVAATPTVSVLGTGMLLLAVVGATVFAPFAPIVALLGAGAAGIGTFGSISDGTRRRRASDVEKAIQRQSVEYEHQLHQQFYSEWKQFSDDVRDSVAASKRRLNLLLMQKSAAQDGVLSDTYRALTNDLTQIDKLRRELHWLEQNEQSAIVGAESVRN